MGGSINGGVAGGVWGFDGGGGRGRVGLLASIRPRRKNVSTRKRATVVLGHFRSIFLKVMSLKKDCCTDIGDQN